MDQRWFAIWLLAGCLEPSLVPCGDKLCPAGALCVDDRVCATADALAACDGAADGTLCQTSTVDGTCAGGVCTSSVCGDGAASGREQCDGGDLLDATCGSFRFYEGELACTTSCLIDTNGCRGYCGDGFVQSAFGETCDGAKPLSGCTNLGNDYGHIRCLNDRCVDSSSTDCFGFHPRPLVAGITFATDVWREGDVLVISQGGLVVLDRGVRHDHDGQYGSISAFGGRIEVANGSHVEFLDGIVPMLEPDPMFGGSAILRLAHAPNGDLWALAESCKLAILSNGTWRTQTTPVATGCSDIAIDAAAHPYLATGDQLFLYDNSQWVGVLSSHVSNFGEGNNGAVLALTNQGTFELDGTTVKQTPLDDYAIDAVAVGNSYLAGSLALAAYAPNRPVLYDVELPDATNMRRLADGSILIWGHGIYQLQPLLAGQAIPGSVFGMYRDDAHHLAYVKDLNTLALLANTITEHTFASSIHDVSMATGVIYVALGNQLMTGSFENGWQSTPIAAEAVWGDGDGNAVIVDTNRNVVVLQKGAPPTTLPAGRCSAGWVEGYALDEIYVLRTCGDLDRWNGTQWTTVATGAFTSRPRKLDDGTLAITGATSIVGRGTSWKTLAVDAQQVSGTSEHDLWFAATLSTLSGMAHWNGEDLAEVRYPNNDVGNAIMADANTVLMSSGGELRPFARFALP